MLTCFCLRLVDFACRVVMTGNYIWWADKLGPLALVNYVDLACPCTSVAAPRISASLLLDSLPIRRLRLFILDLATTLRRSLRAFRLQKPNKNIEKPHLGKSLGRFRGIERLQAHLVRRLSVAAFFFAALAVRFSACSFITRALTA
jgi:hypothetical protein